MKVKTEIINGFNVGVEYFNDVIFGKGILLDVIFLRFMITWGK